jgi:hypothetical protein
MIIQNNKSLTIAFFLSLSSVIIAVVTYSFLYFNLVFLSVIPEESAKLIVQYKNSIAIILGLITFFGVKKDFNYFTDIELGISVYLPSVLTTVSLISYTLS